MASLMFLSKNVRFLIFRQIQFRSSNSMAPLIVCCVETNKFNRSLLLVVIVVACQWSIFAES